MILAKVFQRCKEEWDPPCTKARCGHDWTVRYREPGGRTGRQREQSFPRAKEARAFESRIENQKNEGLYLDPKRGAVSVAWWADQWLKNINVSEGTFSNYSGFVRNWVVPAIGDRTLAGLRMEHVQTVPTAMRESGLAASTILDRFDILYKMLNAAIRAERIRNNPCEGVSLPTAVAAAVNQDDIPILEEVEAIHEAMVDYYKLTVRLMSGGGLRVSEALAFNRGCPRGDFMRISQQISSKANREDCKTRLVPLKHRTEKEYRDVPLVPLLRQDIDWHLDEFGTDLLISGNKEVEVFFAPRQRGKGTMPTATTYGYHWVKALKACGLVTLSGKHKYTPHDLRHFFASVALANNLPILELSRWLGHKSFKTTADIYGHMMADAVDRFLLVMQAALTVRRPALVAA
ncbi:integrase [Actinokineospora baliensis]|uniref:tyrosine-type recombinase/integrase n=1 Tax=Actinokineospora baliensis TaxID=547056 RepID=UPI001957FBE2|nr:site-specific integrase [Actinokineospora baliensis]MBM7771990.1 integrase [Actinokineospora baliensis]